MTEVNQWDLPAMLLDAARPLSLLFLERPVAPALDEDRIMLSHNSAFVVFLVKTETGHSVGGDGRSSSRRRSRRRRRSSRRRSSRRRSSSSRRKSSSRRRSRRRSSRRRRSRRRSRRQLQASGRASGAPKLIGNGLRSARWRTEISMKKLTVWGCFHF
jgi:hypothetical protein